MAQPLFALQNRSGGSVQVYRVTGASPQAFGDPLGAALASPANDESRISNRVIQFQNDVYAVASDGVYKKTDPTSLTGAWTQDHAFTSVAAASAAMAHQGPYQIVLSGVNSLFCIWRTITSNNTWNASILDGSTGLWSDVGEQTAGVVGSSTNVGQGIVYRGVLYVPTSTAEITTFDPGASSFGLISTAGVLDRPTRAGFGIFNDRLLALGRDSGTGDTALFEITGGVVTKLFSVGAFTDPSATREELKNALFPSPGGSVLYGLSVDNTTGTRFLKFIDTGGTISYDSDISNPVLPAGQRVGAGPQQPSWWAFYDQETTPGTARLLIHQTPDSAASSLMTQYVFVDEATELTQEDSGADAAWAYSATMTGGGERIFTPGELHIEIVNRSAVLGGEAVQFKAFGDAGSADKNVEFRFNTENEVPLTLATLTGTPSVVSGPGAAPTLNVGLKRLESVEADGVTIYETVWNISADAVTAGQRAQLVPRVFV